MNKRKVFEKNHPFAFGKIKKQRAVKKDRMARMTLVGVVTGAWDRPW